MIAAIRLVKNCGYNLPLAFQADLEIRIYKMFRSIEDQIAQLQDNFKSIVQKEIQQALIVLDEKERNRRKKTKRN
jgi:hypothetical protein